MKMRSWSALNGLLLSITSFRSDSSLLSRLLPSFLVA